jgi:hypothetical protein
MTICGARSYEGNMGEDNSKGVVSAWKNINLFEEWSLGDGKSINVWNDKWLGDQLVLATDMGNIPESISNLTVADLVDSGSWTVSAN